MNSILIAIALLITGCSFRPELDPVITPFECKRACSPALMVSIDALNGTCQCGDRL